MGWVRIHPRWQKSLHQRGLVSAVDFLRLPGIILCGHPDRHVLKVQLSSLNNDVSLQSAYLKKEHRVPWRDRLANAVAGFGFVSKSTREALVLQKLAQAGLPCPEVIAYGAGKSQAFLLLGEKPGAMDIRHYVARHPERQRFLAHHLADELARIHAAGFVHGDLYSKHIFVGSDEQLCFLDWQQTRQQKKAPWKARCRDLAALDATLLDSLMKDRLRLHFLRRYLKNYSNISLKSAATQVRQLSLKLQRKPRIQAIRRLPLPQGAQNLVWLDGEAMCLTQTFYREMRGQAPDWLRFRSLKHSFLEENQVPLGEERTGNLVQRATTGFGRFFLGWLGKMPAPEVQQAAHLFRLERHQIACPKLLAFGQIKNRHWSRHSFLLTEAPVHKGTLHDFLSRLSSPSERGKLLREAGALLRRLHEAGYFLGKKAGDFASLVAVQTAEQPSFTLTGIDGLRRSKRCWSELALRDIPNLQNAQRLRSTEKLRFFLGYCGSQRLNPLGRDLARKLLARRIKKVTL